MRTPVALLAPISRGGAASDIEGVEIGRAKNDEPFFIWSEFSRYCGPEEKFVSWPEAIPAETTSNIQQRETRIEPPRHGSCELSNRGSVCGQSRWTLLSALVLHQDRVPGNRLRLAPAAA